MQDAIFVLGCNRVEWSLGALNKAQWSILASYEAARQWSILVSYEAARPASISMLSSGGPLSMQPCSNILLPVLLLPDFTG